MNPRKQEWLEKMAGSLTVADLDAIEEVANAASPAPWILAITPKEWGRDEIAANQVKMISEGGERAHFCIHPDDADDDAPRATAFCGNGPTSEANARFVEIARVALPMLVRKVRRLRSLMERR